ncbi:MAG: hypothetical protein IJR67_00580 [Acholeplasmatales bacterium]|nr:hypothetical protein [Acholeplasmatales bacterium]
MASKSKRNRTKFKWTKELSFLVAFFAVIIVVTIVLNIVTSTGLSKKLNTAINDYNTANSAQYNGVDEDKNVFVEISNSNYDSVVDSIVDKAKSDEYTFFYYGSLSKGEFLENLSTINATADTYEVKTVYLVYSTYVDDAEKNSETNTYQYRKQISTYEDKLNNKVKDNVEKFDMTVAPTLLVYKSGELVFNSQNESDQYSWTIYINQALSLPKQQ